ncbi:MAG: carboxypeptidase regulatory-like domain-containing protein [Planctomycetaceae bacterium]|nr:carboxypeptidase regulatory-like domain-containing protein [Planctomycetaceae bacterium]
MNSLIQQLVAMPAGTPMVIFLDVVIKATFLLLLAAVVNACLWKRSAAIRHRVWCLAFCGLLVLPVLTTLLPSLRLPILPQLAEATATQETNIAKTEPPLAPSEADMEPVDSTDMMPQPLPQDAMLSQPVDRSNWDALQPPMVNDAAPIEITKTVVSDTPATVSEMPESKPSQLSWGTLTGGFWAVGACLALWPLLIGSYRNRSLRRTADATGDDTRDQLVRTLSDSLGLTRSVRLLETGRSIVPMTWGVLRPIVLFPVAWREWSAQRRRLVLLHELAHVKRCDVAFQLIARLTCALYWFHPMAWYALRRLRIERELACDDCVLMTGARPSEYAQELLEIARNYQSLALPTTVAMAQITSLEQRIRAVLDRARSHVPLSRTAGRILLAASVLLITGVAVVKPEPRVNVPDGTAAEREIAAQVEKPDDDNQSSVTAVRDSSVEVTVRGRVLLPDGGVAAGATVRAGVGMWAMLKPIVGADYELPVIETVTDDQGRFSISFSKQPYGDLSHLDQRWQDVWKSTQIAAGLPGYGGQWVKFEDVEGDDAITLQLVEDMPVTGRVVDLEGRPIAGVEVQIGGAARSDSGDITAWIDAAKGGELPWTLHKHVPHNIDPKLIGVPNEVKTDGDGRFEVRGIGRERMFSIVLKHQSVAYTSADVVTREFEPFERVLNTPPFEGKSTVYGKEATITVAPSRPIAGVVRDAETGEPMAGVAVESYKRSGYPFSNDRVLKTVTDAEGRYRLTGMPKGDGNQIVARPDDDQPYFIRQVDVPDPTGIDPVTVDIELHRGIWITGRVTDRVTGEPVHARLYYLPYRSNEYTFDLPEFDDDGNTHSDQMRYQTASDGTYRLVGLPGLAVIGAESVHKQYRRGVGYDTLKGPKYRDTDWQDTYRSPINPGPKWPSVMHEVNIEEDVDSFVVDFEMDPGESVSITTLDPDGQPLTGVRVIGIGGSTHSSQSFETHTFEAVNFSPNETRTMRFEKGNLGWIERVSATNAPEGGIIVKLQPLATVTGRLLHEDGSPLTGANIIALPLPAGDFAMRLQGVTTDGEGRFVHTLPAGASYSLSAEGTGIDLSAGIARMLTVKPGESKDLGELRLVDDELQLVPLDSDSAAEQSPSPLVTLHGIVNGPDGSPVSRARVWIAGPPRVSEHWTRQPQNVSWTVLASTDSEGRFRATIDRAQFESAASPEVDVRIAATAKWYGFGWTDVKASALDEELTLQLVDDLPIEGRIVTVDGQPAAGVTLSISQITERTGEDDGSPLDVDALIKAAATSSGFYTNWPGWMGGSPETNPVTTDGEGRFRLEGLGTGRYVRLECSGGDIAATRLSILTHPTPERLQPHGAIAVREGLRESQYLAEFTHVAQPGRTLRGIVKDEKTGDPVPDVKVTATSSWASRRSPAVTGPDGKYEITGVPREAEGHNYEYTLEFRVDDAVHFNHDLRLESAPGQSPLELNVALDRGIKLSGRVTDAATGKPVSGTVVYNALSSNELINQKECGEVANPLSSTVIQEDGSYELCVAPGPGVVAARVDGGPYMVATIDPNILEKLVNEEEFIRSKDGGFRYLSTSAGGQCQGVTGFDLVHAANLVNPTEDASPLTIDLAVEQGHSLQGKILDDEGELLSGVRVVGLGHNGISTSKPLESAEFRVEGLANNRPRTLIFLHLERQLGARIDLNGDETQPLIARLTPTGSITGRFVDKLGEPLPIVDINLILKKGSSALMTEFWWGKIGADGRFQLDGLIPDCEYIMQARIPEELAALAVPVEFEVRSGETIDVGAFVQTSESQFEPFESGQRPDESDDDAE